MEPTTTILPTVSLKEEIPAISHAAKTNEELDKIAGVLVDLQNKVDLIYVNSEKMRRAATRSMWLTIIFVVLPIAISIFALPVLMKTLLGSVGENGGAIDIQSIIKQAQSGQVKSQSEPQ